MNNIVTLLQIIIALGIFNVWILRFHKQTKYRGGQAQNLKEEFAAYGLPAWFVYIIGFLKLSLALLLIIGIWIPVLVKPAAALLGFLMLGALSMHVKIADPIKKALPSLVMFLMSLTVVLLF